MKTEALLEKIKAQFEAKVDAGLIFKIDPEEHNTCFFFEDDIIPKYSSGTRTNRFENKNIDKHDIYRYLTAKMLKMKFKGYYLNYGDSEFYNNFWQFWLGEQEKVENTLALVKKYYAAELTNISDLVITNVDKRDGFYYEVNIFIISQKYITEMSIDEKSLNHRTEHVIQRDIKRIEAKSEHLYVYFHGIHHPFIIKLDTYEEVIKLQRNLLELRNSQNYSNRKYK